MSDNASSQTHFGSGDNVANNKLVFETYVSFISETVPENLQTPIKNILKKITNRKFISAREGINVISGINNLSEEIKELLKLLVVKCDISENPDGANDLGLLQDIFSSSRNLMIKDLALSLLFRSEVLKFGLDYAERRFKDISCVGPFSRAAAFHLFFEKKELIDIFRNKTSTLTEEERIGLINGLFRERCCDEALEAAEDLNRYYDYYNSKVILLFAKFYKLDMSLKDTDYFTLNQKKKNEVVNLIAEAISIFKLNEEVDVRLFNIFIPSLIYVKMTHAELEELCLENIEYVKSFNEDFCDDLKLKNNRRDFSEEHPINIIKKTEESKFFKDEVLERITRKKQVSYNEMKMAKALMPFDDFKRWVDEGIVIEGEFTNVGEKLNRIFVAAIIKDKDLTKRVLNEISQEDEKGLQLASSEFIKMLADSMQIIGLIYESCSLMLKYISGLNEFWCSPFIETLLFNLYRAARYKDLLQLSQGVNEQDKTIDFDNLVIFTHLYFNSAEVAYKLIEDYKHKKNIEFMRLRLLTLIKLNKPELISQDVDNYDYSLFSPPSPVIGNFVALLVNSNQMAAFEKIVVNWFIDSPEKNYRYVSEACLSLVLNENKVDFNPSYDVQGLSRGVQYRDGSKTLTKLISNQKSFSNPYILNPDTALAISLTNAKAGDKLNVGFKSIVVEEILPPYVAIHRLAIQIRDEFNDGSDSFQTFNVSSDPEELMLQLKRSLSVKQSSVEPLQRIISNDIAPLSFKMFLIEKSDHVKAALSLLLNKNSSMKGFVDSGEEHSEAFCTDLITIVYSCLTSFSKFFIEKNIKLYIMQEDIDAINNWIERIDRDKYMVLGESESGEMFFNTSETIREHFGSFLGNLRDVCSILYPLNIIPDNYSQETIALAESFGQNYPKQVYAFKNCGLSYLSIDSQNCFLTKSLVPINLANSSKIFHDARDYVAFSEREEGLFLHIHGAMPYPLMIDDFVKLSMSENDKNGLHLSSLIKKYAGGYNNNIKLPHLMAALMANYCDKSLNDWNLNGLLYINNPFGPRVDRVFNAAAKAIISSNEPGDKETKFAKFFVSLFFY
ncbi:TPA: hypothetical protein ACXEWA_004569, partial [Enterobacter kobei]